MNEAGTSRGRAAGSVSPLFTLVMLCPLLLAPTCDGEDQGGGGAAGDGGASGGGGLGGEAGVAGSLTGGGAGAGSASGAGGEPNGGGGGVAGAAGAAAQGGAGGSGGSSGAGGEGGQAGAAGAGGTAPEPCTSVACGDGCRDPLTEACDDGNDVVVDACSPACELQDFLLGPGVPRGGGDPRPPVGHRLGGSRHPLAAGPRGSAVVLIEDEGETPRVLLRRLSTVGLPESSLVDVSLGTAAVTFTGPALAALPDGAFAVAYTDYDGDGDELGVRLRRVEPGASAGSGAGFANATSLGSQRDAELVWTGRELVVAWEDDSEISTAPDLRWRRFDAALRPLEPEQTLSASAAEEGRLSLLPVTAGVVAAWRQGQGGRETIEVSLAGARWSIGPAFLAGGASDRPALAELDGSHVLVAFTAATWTETGTSEETRLRVAVLDLGQPGEVGSTLVPSRLAESKGLASHAPAALRFAEQWYLTWQTEALSGSEQGEELWLKELTWDAGASQLDLSRVETSLPLDFAHRQGDQRALALAVGAFPEGLSLIAVWEDWGRTFGAGSGAPDVVAWQRPWPWPNRAPSALWSLDAASLSEGAR